MNYFIFKTALIATLVVTSSFASDNYTEEEDQGSSALVCAPMNAGDFDALPQDVMGYVTSCMPIHSLEEAHDIVTVCKYFRAHVVPYMRFSWKPQGSVISLESKFARAYAPRVVMLDLLSDTTFTNIHLQDFKNLTALDLSYNTIVTNEAVKKLTNLKSLTLLDNTVVGRIQNLTNLTELNLLNNIIVKKIQKLTNLTDLSLMCNIVIKDIQKLVSLRSLNLLGNKIVTNEDITCLTNLTHLNLGHNTTVTNEAVMCLPNLVRLNLSYNNTITHEGYGHLPNLEIIRKGHAF